MQGIEAALQGTLGRDPELRTSQQGKPWTRLAVAVVQETRTESAETIWVGVACFGEVAERVCAQAHKGSRVYCEGQLRLGEWTNKAGEKQKGLELAAWRAQVVGAGAIGVNKVAKKAKPETQQPSNGNGAQRDWQRPLDADRDAVPF
jgi:single stranded DNA-binding protein